jgi:hypothetical protein
MPDLRHLRADLRAFVKAAERIPAGESEAVTCIALSLFPTIRDLSLGGELEVVEAALPAPAAMGARG